MTQPIPFVHCPPGLFWHGETLCFRSEYGDDAYIVASGEFFVGGVRRENRNSLMVIPVDPDDADAALRTVPDSRVAQHARLYLAVRRFALIFRQAMDDLAARVRPYLP